MAELSANPKDWELEDVVAAYFVSRGCYVETGISERRPEEILELDIVATDYRITPSVRHVVEVKSGDFGIGDVFKFYGWTQYLKLPPGEFIHSEKFGRDAETIKHLTEQTGLKVLYIPDDNAAVEHFKELGLPEPSWDNAQALWRYSFWAQRKLLKVLNEAIRRNVCIESAKAAKKYHDLINNSSFFIPAAALRINALMEAHLEHQELGATAAYEIETGKLAFKDIPRTTTFRSALFAGTHFPVQSCFYLAHRARLYILKALVDNWLARADENPKILRILMQYGLTQAMINAMGELRKLKSFLLLPVFWQVFLWSWGGFFLKEKQGEEFKLLSMETGVPIEEIPVALKAFDMLFPIQSNWFRDIDGDNRKVLMLMPAAMRGIGAYRRLIMNKIENYEELGYRDATTERLLSDHNAGAKLLDLPTKDLLA